MGFMDTQATMAAPVPTRNAAANIRAALQAEIENGKLPPGSPLEERGLAERFGVSRTPVREALQQLAAKELVRITPRHGAMVARMTVSEVRGLMEVLGELESFAARLAARRIDNDSRSQLEAALEKCRAAEGKGAAEYAIANIAFHEVVFAASRNEYLTQQLRRAHRLVQRYRTRDFQSPAQMAKSLADHEAITHAICHGNEEVAGKAMSAHVPSGSTGFSEFLAKVPPQFFESESV